jgi:hypothetical protein
MRLNPNCLPGIGHPWRAGRKDAGSDVKCNGCAKNPRKSGLFGGVEAFLPHQGVRCSTGLRRIESGYRAAVKNRSSRDIKTVDAAHIRRLLKI